MTVTFYSLIALALVPLLFVPRHGIRAHSAYMAWMQARPMLMGLQYGYIAGALVAAVL